MPRYVLEVMYDGTCFHGSQVQGDTPTVQLYVNNMLSTLLRKPTGTVGASRTDEGVHAICNYYHYDTDVEPGYDFLYKCNAILPHGVAVRKLFVAHKPEFNARFDAEERAYRYRLYAAKNPFLHGKALYYPFPMRMDMLHETANVIKEYTDFESFAKRNTQSKTFVCKIQESYWQEESGELQYVVKANRFLRGMVRGLVATQLRMAKGSYNIGDFRAILEARDCTKAFFNVTGNGLYLEHIHYPDGVLSLIQKI